TANDEHKYMDVRRVRGGGATRTLTGVNVGLASTVTGAGKNLTVNGSGTTTFGNSVSGVNALVTDAPGNTVVNGSVNAGSVTLNRSEERREGKENTAEKTHN